MSAEGHHDLDRLMSLVELPGPLPGDLEDRVWRSTAATYAALRERGGSTGTTGGSSVIELVDARPAVRDGVERTRRTTIALLGAAAAVAAFALGVSAVGRGPEHTVPAEQLGAEAQAWIARASSADTILRASIAEADAQRVRTTDFGLSSMGDYLDTVSTSASLASGSFADAPAWAATSAREHRDALIAWSTEAQLLLAEINADSDLFVVEEDLLTTRLEQIQALEEAALVSTCEALNLDLDALRGTAPLPEIQCGVISTLVGPQRPTTQP